MIAARDENAEMEAVLPLNHYSMHATSRDSTNPTTFNSKLQ